MLPSESEDPAALKFTVSEAVPEVGPPSILAMGGEFSLHPLNIELVSIRVSTSILFCTFEVYQNCETECKNSWVLTTMLDVIAKFIFQS